MPVVLAILLAGPGVAAVVSLDLSSLPSAQGWTYSATGPSHAGQIETSIWSTSGTTLSMNTMGSPLVSSSGNPYLESNLVNAFDDISNLYIETNLVNALDDIIVSWRSRVLESTSSFYGWSIHFATGAQGVIVGIGTNGIVLGLGSPSPLAFDATGFHDYRIEFTPGESSFDLFVDDSFFCKRQRVVQRGEPDRVWRWFWWGEFPGRDDGVQLRADTGTGHGGHSFLLCADALDPPVAERPASLRRDRAGWPRPALARTRASLPDPRARSHAPC